ncbi:MULTISPECIES: DUF397 domain-containing protein [unclassified Streptomyces]|uniref:DUF397 domain-containing protein n=1 Tax=unclassified Streptomyces TaxID=2593676 RepID=UPI003811D583
MPQTEPGWQKSSYCAQGEACLGVAATAHRTISLTESADPARAVLVTTPAAWAGFLRSLKEKETPHHG